MALINTTTTGVLGSTFYGDGTGDLTIQQNGVTINKLTAAPAFGAYQSVQQTGISNTTWTKITFTTELFDTNNNYASSRFTPTVAGYYQFNASICLVSTTTTHSIISGLYRNGTLYSQGQPLLASTNFYPQSLVSSVIYLNGSTDYVEIYGFGNTGGTFNIYNTQENTYFNGCLVRAA